VLLSLALAVVILVPLIALTGISPIGKQSIGSSPTMTYTNATMWALHSNTYAGFGLNIFLIIVAVALAVLGLLIYSTKKWVETTE
jgi:hypothetical protein